MLIKKLKVYRAPCTTDIPQIRLQGQWLKNSGFDIDVPIVVKSEENRIVLIPVSKLIE